MYSSPSLLLPLAGLFLSGAVADTCLSYGIDFVNGGSYFINSASTDLFTSVSQFSGCQNDTANVLLVRGSDGEEWTCSDIPLQPDFTSETSTCPIEKEDMTSGEWSLLLISNNGDGDPIAYERDFTLTVATQATVTATATMTFNQTVTPTVTSTSTSVVTESNTVSNTLTVTVPAATKYVTVTPRPVKTTKTLSLTRTLKTWTKTAIVVTSTKTASCTVPPRPQQPDPTCRIQPKNIRLPPGLNIPGKRGDKTVDHAAAVKRFEDARARRAAKIDARDLSKRTIDAATVTVTQTTSTASYTSTFTASTSTVSAIVLSTVNVTTTLPPATVKTGVVKATVTAPAPTKTLFAVTTAYVWQTRTMTAKFTKVTTVTPSASVTACKSKGGHFNNGW